MKKSLLFSAAALMMFGSMSAEMVWKAETVWMSAETQPIAGIDGGGAGFWDPAQKTDPNHKCTVSNSRFAVGKDGVMYTISDIENAIVTFNAQGVKEVFAKIPSRGTNLWNGTAINFDDAGNIVYNYKFTDNDSGKMWGVIKAGSKEQYDINVASGLPTPSRVDCIGHIVGDVTKEAYAFVTFNVSGKVGKLTFKGDGSKTTSLTCEIVQDILFLEGMAGTSAAATAQVSCTFDEFKAEGVVPQNHRFYVPVGQLGDMEVGKCPSFTDGYIAKWGVNPENPDAEKWMVGDNPMGNRGYAAITTFALQGKRYIVRNYVTDEFFAANPNYTKWGNVLNFGIFEAETGKLVASWMDSKYRSTLGNGMLSSEVVDANTVNIYTYAATSKDDLDNTGAPVTASKGGSFAAMVKVTFAEAGEAGETSGSGTAADPYLIATADDLCNAWKLVQANEGKEIYFEQTADIDMAGIKKYEAVNGFDGKYTSSIVYDGKGHLIKNFGPEFRDPSDATMGYYCATIFGVLSGTVKNLGIVDCNIDGKNWGAGGVAAYGGHSAANVTKTANLDNVFVTGKIASDKYAGGMFGTAGQGINISNSYAVVTVTDNKFAGGVVGRLGQPMTFTGSYVMATVNGTGTKGLVAGSNAEVAITGSKSIAIGDGELVAGGATISGVNQAAELNEQTLGRIQSLTAFNEKKMLDGMPTLNWVEIPEESGPGTGTEADPYIIASKEDLMNAHKLIPQDVAGDVVYFKQTADIDMAGVEEYEALNGWGGAYNGKFSYDGDGHLIKNFAPKNHAPVDNVGGYYCQSVFGVVRGEIKNLGIVDCNLDGADFGVGILGGYAGLNGVSATVDNVFVTGKITNGSKYSGGFFGTAGASIEISNSYGVVEVNDSKYAGGVVGRLGQPMTFAQSYVKATVTGDGVKGLVAGSNAAVAITGSKSIAIGAGDLVAGGATISGVNQAAELDATTLGRIQGLTAFNEKKMLNGMPTLNWLTDAQLSGVEDVIVDGIENENAPVEYFNLQGVRVENPSNDLYIKRQGNKVTKVIVR